jgi:hypothetical protein
MPAVEFSLAETALFIVAELFGITCWLISFGAVGCILLHGGGDNKIMMILQGWIAQQEITLNIGA